MKGATRSAKTLRTTEPTNAVHLHRHPSDNADENVLLGLPCPPGAACSRCGAESSVTERIRSPYNNQSISFKLLHHFVVVCEASSLSRAAHVLNVCQSNLTLQMSDLERRMGVQLMHRSWRGVELTEAGQILLPEARSILRRFDKIKLQVQQAHLHGRIDLACASFAVPDYPAVPQAVCMLRRNDARFEVKLLELPSSAQPMALENGQVQMAVMLGKLPNIQFRLTRLRESRIVLLVSTGHALTRASTPVSLRDLGGEMFWMVDRVVEPVLHHVTTRALVDAEVPNAMMRSAGGLKDVIAQVATGSGIALVPDCLRGLDGSGVLTCVDLEESLAIDVVAVHRGLKANKGTKELLNCLAAANAHGSDASTTTQT